MGVYLKPAGNGSGRDALPPRNAMRQPGEAQRTQRAPIRMHMTRSPWLRSPQSTQPRDAALAAVAPLWPACACLLAAALPACGPREAKLWPFWEVLVSHDLGLAVCTNAWKGGERMTLPGAALHAALATFALMCDASHAWGEEGDVRSSGASYVLEWID